MSPGDDSLNKAWRRFGRPIRACAGKDDRTAHAGQRTGAFASESLRGAEWRWLIERLNWKVVHIGSPKCRLRIAFAWECLVCSNLTHSERRAIRSFLWEGMMSSEVREQFLEGAAAQCVLPRFA
jgi:hypothetical protein